MKLSCDVIQSYVITISAGKSNLDPARNCTSHYGVKTIVAQVVMLLYIRRNRNCSLGCSLYEFQQVANDWVRSTIKPHGSQNRAQQTHITEIWKHQQKRLQKQTTGTMQGEGVIVEGISSTTSLQQSSRYELQGRTVDVAPCFMYCKWFVFVRVAENQPT